MFSQRDPQLFLEQWHYIVSLNDKHWFRTTEHILPIELGRKARREDYYLLKPGEIRDVILNAPNLARKSVSPAELNKTMGQIKRNYQIRDDFRSQRLQLRKLQPQGEPDFNTYFENHAEWFIERGLMRYHKNSRGFLKVWQINRPELRFTEQYLRSWFTSAFIPLNDHQAKVDRNDRVDSEQLAYLEWADIFVSDDSGFVPRAFRLLYPEGNKQLLKSDEFIAQLGAPA